MKWTKKEREKAQEKPQPQWEKAQEKPQPQWEPQAWKHTQTGFFPGLALNTLFTFPSLTGYQ